MVILAQSKFIVNAQMTSQLLCLSPKTVIVNNYEDLVLMQDGARNDEMKIKKGERVPLYWF